MTPFPSMPRNRAALAAVRPGGNVDFGLTVPISFDGSHSFSLAGWFRLRSSTDSGALIGKQGEFVLGVKEGRPYARLAGQLASVSAAAPLGNGWHYLAVTYSTTGPNEGPMSLYIDGGLAAQATLSGVGVGPTSNPLAAGGEIAVDVWCLCAFDYAASPNEAVCEWEPMQAAAATAASFCFMQPPAEDHGPHSIPIVFNGGAAEQVATPGVTFGGPGYALPGSGDVLDVAAGSYTVQAWVYPSATPSAATQYVFAEGPSDGPNVSLGLAPASGSLTVVAQHGADVVSGGVVNAGAWQNIAVTYDGTTLTIYLNGQSCGSRTSGAASLTSRAVTLGGAPTSGSPAITGSFLGTVQSIDVWSAALTATELAAFAETFPEEASGGPRLLASYALGPECSNLVSGVPVSLFGGAHVDELLLAPTATAATPPVAHDLGESDLPPSDFRLSVDDARMESVVRDFLDDLQATYGGEDASALIAQVAADLEAQRRRLAETGLLPEGAVTVRREGEELIVYRFTADSAVEVGRLPATMSCADWYIELGVNILGGLLTIFGLKFPATRLAEAIQRWLARYPNLGPALAEVLEETITMRSITACLKILYDASALGPILYSTFANLSWWEIFFFVAAVLLQFAEVIFPNPTSAVFYSLVVAKIATVVIQLGVVMLERPEGC